MSPTIQEIAENLGISKTTVHRALNGTGRISPKTKKRVTEYAKKIGYRPNTIAQTLRTKRSMTIGLILRGIMVGHYYSEILSGIEIIAGEMGYVINIACSGDNIDKEREIIQNFIERRVDGIIIAPVSGSYIENYEQLNQLGVPFVFIDKFVDGVAADVVTADSKDGVKKAVRLLLNTGRKRIAFLNGFEGDCITIAQRIEGYKESLLASNNTYIKIIDSEFYATEDKMCGFLAIKQFINTNSQDNLFDAIVCANDSLAFGALKAIIQSGLRIPEDIALVGNNNDTMTEYVQPMLTTISQPKADMGRMAINLLMKKIEKNVSCEDFGFYSLPVSLLVRGST